jgi:hypothetical protein
VVLDNLRVHSARIESFRFLGRSAAVVMALGAAGNKDANADRGSQEQEGESFSHIEIIV